MRKYKFEEEVVEEVIEETTTEENVEDSPDQREQFISILVDMGLSAEQSEAVHSMAMDLIDAGGSEETTTEVKEEVKVEASRQRGRRSDARGTRRSEFASSNRQEMSEQEEKDFSQARATRRLRKQNIELRKQLRELGASPAAPGLRNAPNVQEEKFSATTSKTLGKGTSQALDMINNYGK